MLIYPKLTDLKNYLDDSIYLHRHSGSKVEHIFIDLESSSPRTVHGIIALGIKPLLTDHGSIESPRVEQ